LKKRRARRKHYNWPLEIARGNTDAFYNSTDFDIAREKVLIRDKGKCQFFLGKWDDGIHKPDKIKLIDANTVHHKISIKERPDICLDLDNLVSLSFEAHEIIEERHRWTWRYKKKPLTEEKW
jgi:5-methylcytosine-specific restriction endonuclease McrA